MLKKSTQPKPYAELLNIFLDDRGTFLPIFEISKKAEFKRIYSIYNHRDGIVRGFHLHKKEWKYFVIVSGAAKFIALDPDNPIEKYEFYSSSRKPNLVVIPPGYANGWISLERDTVLVCCSSATLKESLDDDKRFDPYLWGDVWSIKNR